MLPKREKRVGIYCRVSTNSADQPKSLTVQVSTLTRLTAANPKWLLVDVYIDITSSKTGSSRKKFSRMLQDCKSRDKPLKCFPMPRKLKPVVLFPRTSTSIIANQAIWRRYLFFKESGLIINDYSVIQLVSLLLKNISTRKGGKINGMERYVSPNQSTKL